MIHEYATTIEWTGNTGAGTAAYSAYERNHTIRTQLKANIEASSDPHFRGDASKHNPEELFLAAIASCHMLWYLHLCADAGIIVTSYIDEAAGEMETGKDGSGQFKRIVLSPQVRITEASRKVEAETLHHRAHEMCFLARSVNFTIDIQPLTESVA